jgi:hypothetical protein
VEVEGAAGLWLLQEETAAWAALCQQLTLLAVHLAPVALLACLGRPAVTASQPVRPCLELVEVEAGEVELVQLAGAVETAEAMALVVVAGAVLRLDLTQGLAAMVPLAISK